ncbi:SorU family sulfite dehydrogenase c-type cytochrome subunit [Marinobacter zhejiangensis]|uniref:Cytochrome c, mono-and diheme variants n=1 Tax=Marinobacter zhejiangensis TaxID=488535 RepID=A0A1I4SEL5_9GAMM|nr:cytochrome c [Marinobacter zhejiangensis]SFM62814.1 Cytochrome c, mono-and diheme variants [Marinobacter zhejiangensis]
MTTYSYGVILAGVLLSQPGLGDERLDEGRKVFTEAAQPSCTVCHTLADAGSTGIIGPNLDELAPDEERVRQAVTTGVGIMPAFAETLSEEQISAVAHYVATVTAGQ